MHAFSDILTAQFKFEPQTSALTHRQQQPKHESTRPTDGPAAIYLFQPQQRLLLLSKPVLALHNLKQVEACISMSRLLSCYTNADKQKLNLAYKVAAEVTGVLKVTLQPKTQPFFIEHRLQRLKYGDQCFLCGQLKILTE